MWFPPRIITPWSSSEFFSYARRNVYVLNSIYNKVPRFHQLERLQALFLNVSLYRLVMACFLGWIILDCARVTAKGTPLAIWNVKFRWNRNGVILSHIQSPKITVNLQSDSCNRKSVSFLRNTSVVMLEGNSQLAPDEISQHEHQVSKMLSMIEILHQLIAYYGCIHPRGLKVAKSQVLQRDEEKGHFQAKTSTTTRRWKKSFCLMGRLISFDILILEVEGFWYQQMRLWEGVGCSQHPQFLFLGSDLIIFQQMIQHFRQFQVEIDVMSINFHPFLMSRGSLKQSSTTWNPRC